MSNEIVPHKTPRALARQGLRLPAIIDDAGEHASRKFVEFFVACSARKTDPVSRCDGDGDGDLPGRVKVTVLPLLRFDSLSDGHGHAEKQRRNEGLYAYQDEEQHHRRDEEDGCDDGDSAFVKR